MTASDQPKRDGNPKDELPKVSPATAEALAEAAHAGQVDKAGQPYIGHVRAVAGLLTEHGPHAVMAGLLHDIVEDTDVTLDQLRDLGYPEDVVRAVDAVSRRDDETYMDLIWRATEDPLGRLVKLADNTHNSRPDRLAVLDPQQAAQLRHKYARAREVLLAAAQPEQPENPLAFLDYHQPKKVDVEFVGCVGRQETLVCAEDDEDWPCSMVKAFRAGRVIGTREAMFILELAAASQQNQWAAMGLRVAGRRIGERADELDVRRNDVEMP